VIDQSQSDAKSSDLGTPLFLAAAIAAATAQAIEPFDHGIWLVAYLFLVGFTAQSLLRRGEAALLASSGSPHEPSPQVLLWNVGSVAVPAGVLFEARLLVVVGAISLLAALALFWRSARRLDQVLGDRRAWLRRGYDVLLVVMASSTFIGTALAWDTPWY